MRDPLTERYKHELRELDPDPWDWLERPPQRTPRTSFDVSTIRAVALAIVLAAACAGLLLYWSLKT